MSDGPEVEGIFPRVIQKITRRGLISRVRDVALLAGAGALLGCEPPKKIIPPEQPKPVAPTRVPEPTVVIKTPEPIGGGIPIEGKDPEMIKPVELPSKESRILHPAELSYTEVRPYLGKMRNSHEAILSESLFTRELANMDPEKRERVLDAIAEAHAQALVNHFGEEEAIVGLDPGHGGHDLDPDRDTGSVEGDLVEKNLTWDVANRVAEKLFHLSKGKYHIVFLRPEIPKDIDLDRDGIVSAVERIQKRKALLLKMEKKIRGENSPQIGENIVYVSIHFNGDDTRDENGDLPVGTEVYWPNEIAMRSAKYREGSAGLAGDLQRELVEGIRKAGYDVNDRGALADPGVDPPGANSDTLRGAYNALSSEKLDRDLENP